MGYGDIKGFTKSEFLVQVIVTMSGICLFSWMTGIVQAIIDGFNYKDINDEFQDQITDWLFQVDKIRPNDLLPKSIINLVRDFYTNKFKYD